MGEVYRARDPRLGREVAIKIISNPIANDPHALRRFENEAKAVASLSHPNILAIHDFQTENGVSFAVMELLRGESLADRLLRERLSSRSVVEIGAAVADGLASAHARGIVHRDLKPANIFLTKDGQVKILDFGLAKRNPESNADSDIATETQAGAVVGTVGYMAPEQVSGVPLDGRADIFALGCILYEMISGERAFTRSSAVATLAATLHDNPRDLPDSPLAPIVRRCLQKNPDERFQSARDLAFALRTGTGTASFQPAAPPAFRRRSLWIAAVTIVVVAATATFGFLRYRTTREPISSLAVLPFVNTSHDPQTEFLAEGMTDTIINKLAELPQLKVMSHSTMFRFKGKDADPQQVGRDLNVASVLTGRIVQIGNRLNIETELVNVDDGRQLWGERYDRRLADVFALQDDIAQQISQKLRLKLTGAEQKRLVKRETDDPEAYSLYVQGHFLSEQRTGPALRKAIELFNATVQRDPNYALAYTGLGGAYLLLPVYGDAPRPESSAKARDAAVKALAIDPNLAEAHQLLAGIHAFDYQWNEAEAEFKTAIALKPNLATAHHGYGFWMAPQRRFAQGLAEEQKAFALDPLSPVINRDLAQALRYNGRNTEALAQIRRTISLDPVPGSRSTLCDIYFNLGRPQDALQEAQRNGMWDYVVRAYVVLGRKDDALKVVAAMLEMQRPNDGSLYQLGLAYAALGDRAKAYAALNRALREHVGSLPFINADPLFDTWRSDPQFQQLLRAMNLAQ